MIVVDAFVPDMFIKFNDINKYGQSLSSLFDTSSSVIITHLPDEKYGQLAYKGNNYFTATLL